MKKTPAPRKRKRLTRDRLVFHPTHLPTEAPPTELEGEEWEQSVGKQLRGDFIMRFWFAPPAHAPPTDDITRNYEHPEYTQNDPEDTYFRYNCLSGIIQMYIHTHNITPPPTDDPEMHTHHKIIASLEAIRSSNNNAIQVWTFFYALWTDPALAIYLIQQDPATHTFRVDINRFDDFMHNALEKLILRRLNREIDVTIPVIATQLIYHYVTAGGQNIAYHHPSV